MKWFLSVWKLTTTSDIARQILRHRSFSFQEFSQRYADPNDALGQQVKQDLQDFKNRQNSIETDDNALTTKMVRSTRFSMASKL